MYNGAYEFSENEQFNNINKKIRSERIFTYDEAIDLTGKGWYNRSLLLTMSLSILSMSVDIFGFSVVVTGCACDFDLDHSQKSILISVPFIGPILMSYFWGYISDTQGRRKTLLIGLWGSFIASTISSFSSHWYMLVVLKIIGTSLSSSVQSASYTFLGESCPEKLRHPYMLIMSSAMMLFVMCYVVPAYLVLNLEFRYPLGYIFFTPWRLLCLIMAAPLGISAALLQLFKESPKFLFSVGKDTEALNNLRIIWKRNGEKDIFPVTKMVLNEEIRLRTKDESFMTLLIDQMKPLFKPPLLWRTLQLFYLLSVVYGVNNSLIMWMPIIVEAFTSTLETGDRRSLNLCDIITSTRNTTFTGDSITCISSINERTLFSGIAHGVIFSVIALAVSKFAFKKKIVMITFLAIPMMCSFAAIYNQNDVASLILYVGIVMTNICMGVVFSYFVVLYPTSYSGMASCLGVMVSRLSALVCIHFVGALVNTHCTATFYAFTFYLLSGIIVAYFLPPDKKIVGT